MYHSLFTLPVIKCWTLIMLLYRVMILFVYRMVFSTSEVIAEKNSELFHVGCQHLNVTCDGHVMLTIEACIHFCIYNTELSLAIPCWQRH